MNTELLIGIMTLASSGIGTLVGIVVNSKLVNYRIQKLEEEVRTHNNFARRMPVVEEQIKVINHRIEDLEGKNE